MNLPNTITLARLLSVPAIVWLVIEGHWLGSFVVFVAAGLSDAIDGAIARRTGGQTALGAYLDPIADKVLLTAVYLTLAAVDRLPSWLAILVVSRDVLIVGGWLVAGALGANDDLRPSLLSKANTAMQIILAAVALAGIAFMAGPLVDLAGMLAWVVAGTTLASGIGYGVLWMRGISHAEGMR